MIAILGVFAVASVVIVALTPLLRRRIFFVAAIVPFVGFVHALLQLPAIMAGGEIHETVPWIPQLSLALSARLDALSLVLALVVTGVGTLVMLYCARYFQDDEISLGRFAAIFLAFAGSMYGLVIADDVYLLFMFWEATSVFSYMLIGHYTAKKASRSAALQALLVTTLGGLIMLVGFVLLAIETGTSSLSGIVAAAPSGTLVTVVTLGPPASSLVDRGPS